MSEEARESVWESILQSVRPETAQDLLGVADKMYPIDGEALKKSDEKAKNWTNFLVELPLLKVVSFQISKLSFSQRRPQKNKSFPLLQIGPFQGHPNVKTQNKLCNSLAGGI